MVTLYRALHWHLVCQKHLDCPRGGGRRSQRIKEQLKTITSIWDHNFRPDPDSTRTILRYTWLGSARTPLTCHLYAPHRGGSPRSAQVACRHQHDKLRRGGSTFAHAATGLGSSLTVNCTVNQSKSLSRISLRRAGVDDKLHKRCCCHGAPLCVQLGGHKNSTGSNATCGTVTCGTILISRPPERCWVCIRAISCQKVQTAPPGLLVGCVGRKWHSSLHALASFASTLCQRLTSAHAVGHLNASLVSHPPVVTQ